jgi:hypothetical protein
MDVDIRVHAQNGRAVIEIHSDAGPAPDDSLESVVGLALCRALIEPLGGHIELGSGPRNTEGSALVRLTLPITP